jgi:hypothetical protein
MTLDMSRPDLQRSETVTQGDTNRRWEVTLINGGAPFRLPPNWTAALTGIKPDGNGLLNGCSVVDGKIIYDFAAGKEIATCVGSYPVHFDIWDEVGELVASPKVYVNVLADVRPHAELESEGQYTLIGDAIKKITDMEKDVDLLADTALNQGDDITALKEKITTAGTVTIHTTQWSYTTPHTAYMGFPSNTVQKGQAVLFMPLSDATKEAAAKARLSVGVDEVTDGGGDFTDYVLFVQAEEGAVPTVDLDLGYIVLRTAGDLDAMVALIGVDAYGENSGTASGVDESAVKKIINSMLGNVDNVLQYSAANPPPYPVTSVNNKTGAVTLVIPSKAADVKAEEAGAVSTHNADQIAHPYLSGRVANALDRIGGHDTDIEEINTSMAERLKTADLAAKLDDYKAAQGLVSNTTSNLTNYYLKNEIYTKEEVAALISAIPKFEIKVVTSLPTVNISLTTVYLVKDTTEGGGLYTEYIYVNGAWEELGSQTVDLSGYVTDEELENMLKSYATLTQVSELIADALKPYATDEEVDEAIRVATVNFVTGAQVTMAINNALNAYYTSAQVDAEIAAQIKTALSPYITAAKAAEMYQPAGDYAKRSDVPTKTSQLNNDSGFLTQHQSLEHLLPKNQGTANAGKLMMVADDGSVTYIAISDLGLSGGDVVGNIDRDKNIVLTGDLAPGTYTFAYLVRKSDGTTETVTIGTYTVEDESETKTYTIRWVNYGGEVLKTVTVAEGDSEPEYDGQTPTRAEDGQYTYTFKGWDKTVDDATGDVTYTATYTQTAKPAEPAGPTNYANPSDTLWQVNNRLATGYGNGKTDGGTGHILTNFVPAKLNDEIYVTGLDLKAYADSKPAAVGIYTNNTDPQTDYQKKYALTGVTGTANIDGAGDKVTATTANGVTTYVYKILEKNNGDNIADSNTAYIRIDGIAIEGVADSAIVINVKRDGEWL